MKIFRRVLGGILMIPSAIVIAAFFLNFFIRFDKKIDTAFNIVILLVYAGIFFLGYKIFGFNKKSGSPAKARSAGTPVPREKPAGAGEPPRESGAAGKFWGPAEASVRLYSDSSARFSKKPALSSLVQMCDQGTPVMVCGTVYHFAGVWPLGGDKDILGDEPKKRKRKE